MPNLGTILSNTNVIAGAEQAAIADLTNNTGQTPNDVVENVPDATIGVADASVASVNAAIAAIERNLADLLGKINAILAVMRTLDEIAP